MTKRDYDMVASAIAETRRQYKSQAALDRAIEHMAIRFRQADKLFSRADFDRACRGQIHCDECKEVGY